MENVSNDLPFFDDPLLCGSIIMACIECTLASISGKLSKLTIFLSLLRLALTSFVLGVPCVKH